MSEITLNKLTNSNEEVTKNKGSSERLLISTRILNAPPDEFDPNEPRLGRRESEPHSHEITYLYDVLSFNFPDSRTLWDLHHYFEITSPVRTKIDIQFDISFFLGWRMSKLLTSYNAEQFKRIPSVAINILSRKTWKTDFSEHRDYCEALKIPIYIVYPSYHVASNFYKPPFLRIYRLKGDKYEREDIRKIAMVENGELKSEGIISLGDQIPFRIGLMERSIRLVNNEKIYRLIIIDKKEDKILPTRAEYEHIQFLKEKERADKEKERADKEKERADKEKERADQLEEILKKYKEKYGVL
ncbi:MAG: hypothetical protein ACTSRZ_02130 [Promethearchaeota archaeon]